MNRTNFRQPIANVKINILGKTLTEVCSPHLYSSFGTFYAQIGHLFEAQWVFKHSTRVFLKIFHCAWAIGCRKFVQYIHSTYVCYTPDGFFGWICVLMLIYHWGNFVYQKWKIRQQRTMSVILYKHFWLILTYFFCLCNVSRYPQGQKTRKIILMFCNDNHYVVDNMFSKEGWRL